MPDVWIMYYTYTDNITSASVGLYYVFYILDYSNKAAGGIE